jgi:ectoine hydroxylase-related dioxygenase (phytanoyl-CoA dioxygenase family)
VTLETHSAGVLTKADVERFERDGFFIIDEPCSPDLFDAVIADCDPMYRDAWDPGPEANRDGVFYGQHGGWRDAGYHWHRIRNAWKVSDNVRAIALSPRVLAITEQLFGRPVKPFQTLNFPVGTEQVAHADSFPFQSDPPGYMCGVWVALEDMDMDNGPLVYYPGSHKMPMPSWKEIEKMTGYVLEPDSYENERAYHKARHHQYADYCTQMIEDHDLQPEYGTIARGQALLWAPNLMHGGSPQRDRSRTRHSQVTHYFFGGCRVYTPMHVEGEHIFWDYPEWIRDPVPVYGPDLLKETVREHTPTGSSILAVTPDGEPLLELEDRNVQAFPDYEAGAPGQALTDTDWLNQLRDARARGAEYVVFPKPNLWQLEWRLPSLQDELEFRGEGLLRDGCVAAIYRL